MIGTNQTPASLFNIYHLLEFSMSKRYSVESDFKSSFLYKEVAKDKKVSSLMLTHPQVSRSPLSYTKQCNLFRSHGREKSSENRLFPPLENESFFKFYFTKKSRHFSRRNWLITSIVTYRLHKSDLYIKMTTRCGY